MSRLNKIAKEYHYCARSKKGMWVASSIDDDGISIFWQRRVEYKNNSVNYFDYNGKIEKSVECANMDNSETMIKAGTIPVITDIEFFCGYDQIEDMIRCIGKHSVDLLCCGYGETPGELVEYLSDYDNMFVVDGRYIVKNGTGLLYGVDGAIIDVKHGEYVLDCKAFIAGEEFEIEINRDNIFDFLISTYPV